MVDRPSQALAGRTQVAEKGVGSLGEGRRCAAEEARRSDGTLLVDQPLPRPAVQRVAAQPIRRGPRTSRGSQRPGRATYLLRTRSLCMAEALLPAGRVRRRRLVAPPGAMCPLVLEPSMGR